MLMIGRYVFVEDTHGARFHRILIRKLIMSNYLNLPDYPPIIRRLPAKKCNQAISRKILAIFVDYADWKIVAVIDSEHKEPSNAMKDVTMHFDSEHQKRLRIVVIHPMHEAWLCIGLGVKPGKCRNSPIEEIQIKIGKPYGKPMLGKLAQRIKIQPLLKERDFQEYIDAIKWLYRKKDNHH